MKRPDLRRARWGPSVARVPPGVRPDWTIVLRGYDTDQVDAILTELEAATERPTTVPHLRIAFRGYERHGVETYLQQLLDALPAPTDSSSPT